MDPLEDPIGPDVWKHLEPLALAKMWENNDCNKRSHLDAFVTAWSRINAETASVEALLVLLSELQLLCLSNFHYFISKRQHSYTTIT